MSDWPTLFPQTPLRSGYTDSEVDTVIRSPMGHGPAKIRPLTQVPLYNSVQTFTITDAEKATFETFYADNKALRFNWDNTLGDGVQEYRFLSPPQYQEVTCDLWRMQVQLERMP